MNIKDPTIVRVPMVILFNQWTGALNGVLNETFNDQPYDQSDRPGI